MYWPNAPGAYPFSYPFYKTPGSLGGEMVSTLAWNARDVGSILTLDEIFPICISHMRMVVMMNVLYNC